jgi:sec-independent protein translocase protein TatC
MPEADRERMPFLDHLVELRKRVLYALVALAVGFAVAYGFAERIFGLLTLPFNRAYKAALHRAPVMITTSLLESFVVYLKVGAIAGLFLASPFLFAQAWLFVAPALRPNEKRHAVPLIALATLFFVGGALFGYFAVFPVGFRYFLELTAGGTIQPMIRMKEYFDLAALMLLIFGAIFELPLLVLYLTFVGILRAEHLTRPWRGIVIGIAVGAALLSPPDPGSMLFVFVPMVLLYGVTILFALLVARRRA